MILEHLTLTLLLAAPAAAAPEVPGSTPGDYEALVEEYGAAVVEWRKAYEAASLDERKAIRERHPARELWPRFEAAADSGAGLALLWMAAHARDKGLKREQAAEVKSALYGRVFADHLAAPWLPTAISRVRMDARSLGSERAEALLLAARKGAVEPYAQALAGVLYADLLAASDDAEKRATGDELIAAYEKENVLVGARAVDFSAATVDGHRFKLSDYRGKVVLLDFYGFW